MERLNFKPEVSPMRKHFTLSMTAIIVVLLCDVVAFSQSGEKTAENEKISQSNEIILRTFKAGNEALLAKNYDEAIKQYDEGVAADPQHPGVPSLLTNKSVALRARGVERYNAALASKDEEMKLPGMEAAKSDLRDAAAAATSALQMLKAQAPPSDTVEKVREDRNKYYALAARAEAMRLMVVKVDPTQADAGLAAYQEYIEAETALDKKTKAQLDVAKMLLDVGASEKAFGEYEKILATDPDNADGLFGAGFALAALGDKTKNREAVNYLRRFLSVAPATHIGRDDAQAMIAIIQEPENSATEGSKAKYEGDMTTPTRRKAAPTRKKATPTRRKTP
jgi:tetratricopeptide (TPR) repeat protein